MYNINYNFDIFLWNIIKWSLIKNLYFLTLFLSSLSRLFVCNQILRARFEALFDDEKF